MDNHSIKENIRRARKKKGLSQLTMAERLGVAESTYWEIETGSTLLLNPNLEKIAVILECSIEDFVCGNSESETDGLLEANQAVYLSQKGLKSASTEKLEEKYAALNEEKNREIARLQEELKIKGEMISLLKSNLDDKDIIIRMKDKELKILREASEN